MLTSNCIVVFKQSTVHSTEKDCILNRLLYEEKNQNKLCFFEYTNHYNDGLNILQL